MKKICVLGLGYIGLPTASILATQGYQVLGVDINPRVVDLLNKGRVHIVEPDLDTVLSAAVKSGHLKAARRPANADVFMICVPTPLLPNSKKADLRAVKAAAESIVPYLRSGNLVVVESTIPPDTTEGLVIPILEKSGLRAGSQILVAHCPERVLPGRILTEMVQNHRIIGGLNAKSLAATSGIYKSFVKGEIFETDLKTAELTKLLENSYRDINIAFANEVSQICEQSGIDPWRAIELANKHPRVRILSPGPGVGGHCIAVDPWFLVERFPTQARLIRTARLVNDDRPEQVVARVVSAASHLKNARICCLGITYKADVDDIRESPALEVAQRLKKRFGSSVAISDPFVPSLDGKRLPSWKKGIANADIVVLLVDHREFRSIPLTLLRRKTVIDTRGVWKSLEKN